MSPKQLSVMAHEGGGPDVLLAMASAGGKIPGQDPTTKLALNWIRAYRAKQNPPLCEKCAGVASVCGGHKVCPNEASFAAPASMYAAPKG